MTKNWVEIHDESRGTYNEDNQIRFKNLKFKSSLYDYSNIQCISKINNMQVDDAHEVMPIYNLKEYSDNYSKTSGILWQYGKDEPALADDATIGELLQIMLTILIRLKLSKI